MLVALQLFASCLFVVEQLGCCLSFKSEAVYETDQSRLTPLISASCLFVVEQLGCCLSFKSEAVFESDQLRLTPLIAASYQTTCWGCSTWILTSEAVFASCLFVVEQLGCWGSSNLKQSLLPVFFVVELLGCCLSFKSEAVFRKRISQLDGVDRNCSALVLSVLLVRTSSRVVEL